MSIRIILSDDHKIVREGIRSLLEKQPDMEIVGEAEDGYATLKLVDELLPNIVIIDVAMATLNGIETTRQIIDKHPEIKVIALSMYSDKRLVVKMLKAGASGYLLKDCAFEELVKAIRVILVDQIYLCSMVAGIVVREHLYNLATSDSPQLSTTLSNREQEVLQLLAEGKSVKEIASHLSLSIKTIETYRQQLMNKLNIRSIAELTKYAIREGITTL